MSTKTNKNETYWKLWSQGVKTWLSTVRGSSTDNTADIAFLDTVRPGLRFLALKVVNNYVFHGNTAFRKSLMEELVEYTAVKLFTNFNINKDKSPMSYAYTIMLNEIRRDHQIAEYNKSKVWSKSLAVIQLNNGKELDAYDYLSKLDYNPRNINYDQNLVIQVLSYWNFNADNHFQGEKSKLVIKFIIDIINNPERHNFKRPGKRKKGCMAFYSNPTMYICNHCGISKQGFRNIIGKMARINKQFKENYLIYGSIYGMNKANYYGYIKENT